MNQLDICKCIHSIYYMISKEVALSVEILITMETLWNLFLHIGRAINQIEYSNTCLKKATYISNTSLESIADEMNFYVDTKTTEICFIWC